MVLEHHKSMISTLEGIRSTNKTSDQSFIRAYPDFNRIKLIKNSLSLKIYDIKTKLPFRGYVQI